VLDWVINYIVCNVLVCDDGLILKFLLQA
jgi:hypothetical protein